MKYRDCIGTNVIEIECDNDDGSGSGSGLESQCQKRKMKGILALYRHRVNDEVVDIVDVDVDDNDDNVSNESNNNANAFSSSSSSIPNTCYSSIPSNSSQERKEDEDNNSTLFLSITDGSDTYHGRINTETIKLPFMMQTMHEELENEQQKKNKKCDWLTDILLHCKKDITTMYKLSSGRNISHTHSQCSCYNEIIDSDGSNSGVEDYKFIKIIIKQSERNVVRIVYKGELLPSRAIDNDHNNNYTTKSRISGGARAPIYNHDNNVMDFLHSIATSYNQSISQINTLKNDNKKLEKELYGWRDTATKLENSWQNEKGDTLQRYLFLLNRVKHDLRCTKKELEEEKNKRASLQKKYSTRSTYVANGNHRKKVAIDHEDEHDVEIFDDEEVSLLAQGKKVNINIVNKERGIFKRETSTTSNHSATSGLTTKSVGTAAKLKTPHQESSCSTSSTVVPPPVHLSENSQHFSHSQNYSQTFFSQSSMRENPHTGSIEVWDAEDLFREYDNSVADSNIPDHNISSQLSHFPPPSPSPSDKADSPSPVQSPGRNDKKRKKLDSALHSKGKKRSRADDSIDKKKEKKKKRIKQVTLSGDFTISEEL